MSLTIPKTVAAAAQHATLTEKAEARYGGDEIRVSDRELTLTAAQTL